METATNNEPTKAYERHRGSIPDTGVPDDNHDDGGTRSANCYLDQDGDGVGSGAPVECPELELDNTVELNGHELMKGIARVGGDCDDLSTARAPGFVETCDEVDNDCDGIVNEGYDLGAACDGVGACGEGAVECATLTTTRCSTDAGGSQDQSALDETACDGNDEDCDGEVDESWDVGKACDAAGLCGLGVLECATADSVVCSTGKGGSASEAIPEVCDGLDNDCDGIADNGLKVLTYWADCDDDGYGAGAAFSGCKPPVSGNCGFVTNNKDCGDNSDKMKPGQTGYYSSPVSSSFDYNCNYVVEKLYTRTRKDCTDFTCGGRPYWSGEVVPQCGTVAEYCDITGCNDRWQVCH